MQKSVSIGYYHGSDGDFAILATVNNKNGHLTDAQFNKLVVGLKETYNCIMMETIHVLDREDTPDYIDSEGDGHSF
jgi:hypothetical protein